MAKRSFGVVPPDDEERLIPDAPRGRRTLVAAVRDFLRLKGAAIGVAMVVLSVAFGVAFVAASGVKLWTR